MRRLFLLAALLALLPIMATAALQEGTEGDLGTWGGAPPYRMMQMIRMDITPAITGSGTPSTGESAVTSGDWTKSMDCRGFTTIGVWFFEYGGGSGTAQIWNSSPQRGFDDPLTNSDLDPAETPTNADPDNLGVDLTNALGVSLDGLAAGTQWFSETGLGLGIITGEIGTCATNCDSVLTVICSP